MHLLVNVDREAALTVDLPLTGQCLTEVGDAARRDKAARLQADVGAGEAGLFVRAFGLSRARRWIGDPHVLR